MLQSANVDRQCLVQEMPFNFTNGTSLSLSTNIDVMPNFYVANSGHSISIDEKAAHKMTISRTLCQQL
jgi:hypothetical protein